MNPPLIISASRRTDLPAFYSDWFMNRIRAGSAKVRHPYSNQELVIPLRPEEVVGIVFWTKNFEPMLKHLDELESRGFFYLVHYTITGLGPGFEPRVPPVEKSIEVFQQISNRIGRDRMLWRFDPIVITDRVGVSETSNRFATISSMLKGHASSVYFSFMQDYARVKRRAKEFEQTSGDRVREPPLSKKQELAQELARIAREHGMSLYACCQPELVGFGVEPAHCIDAGLISRLSNKTFAGKPSPTRKSCGCDFSADLGAYDSCPHLCWYCYANCHPGPVAKNSARHRPGSEFLVE